EAVARLAVLLGGGNAVVGREGKGEGGLPIRPTEDDELEGGIPAVDEATLARAEEMLREVLNSSSPGRVVAERLDEIDALLPALLALNVREARERVHPGLVQSLEGVMGRVNGVNGTPKTTCLTTNGVTTSGKRAPARVLFVRPAGVGIPIRHTLAAEGLRSRGCVVALEAGVSAGVEAFEVIIAHRPHADPSLMKALAQRVAMDVPLVVDVDLDFEQLPGNHAGQGFGLGTPEQARLYMAALLMADAVLVSGEELAGMLRNRGHQVRVIPEGWSQGNRLWEKPSSPRHTINLGLVAGQVEDVAPARRMILRILREFPQTQLVVVGNPQVYQLFEGLPEARRLFLPLASAEDNFRDEDFPYLLGQVDILLAPMRQTPFNMTCSDRVLMEAGVRGIPWVASAVPAFTAWAEGGLIAHSPEEWYTLLHGLITDPTLRRDLGRAGKVQAAAREMSVIGEAWWELVEAERRSTKNTKSTKEKA
ncbi:MAG: hypothetical protein HUU38_19345, partial [Anaerolineales bacterium]|nr:hypothetical protein [Anaerolineales bacterium]